MYAYKCEVTELVINLTSNVFVRPPPHGNCVLLTSISPCLALDNLCPGLCSNECSCYRISTQVRTWIFVFQGLAFGTHIITTGFIHVVPFLKVA